MTVSLNIKMGTNNIASEIFAAITENNIDKVKALLPKDNPNVVDEHGMTALEQAAYKGSEEICQWLIDMGADVNSNQHERSYSALHFAGLSGNPKVCQLLLAAGSKAHATNSIQRTPAQMAAFVGNHKCVAVINNFIPIDDLNYYTKIVGLQTEPKLPAMVVNPLYDLLLQINIHPINILQIIHNSPVLIDNILKIIDVLELLCSKETKKQSANEPLAFKYHYIGFIFQQCYKEYKKKNNKGDIKSQVEGLMKVLSSVADEHKQIYLDKFIRESIKSFPNHNSTIFQQLVANLSQSSVEDCVALNILVSCINGSQSCSESVCIVCGSDENPRKCGRCSSVLYCGKNCQKLHWFSHKKFCVAPHS